MKIGNVIHFAEREKLEKYFEQLVFFGFDNCQLGSWNPKDWTDENAQMVKELCEKYGVTISAFWCGWSGPVVWDFYDGQLTLGLVPPEYRQMRVEQLCAGADWAKKLGVTDVITHMGFIPENPNDPQFAPFCIAVRTVAGHLKKNDQWLLFETGQETPVTMMRCFEKVNMDNLGINLDTANLILYGRANPVDALDVFGKYVRNIHAKDGFYPTNGHSLGREVRLGDGKVDFKALFVKLKELEYDGYVTIEREIWNEQQQPDIIHARDYLTQIINEVYGG
ncbi:MAG: sugar phosphate isomerase/epimerase [Ruminococcaceae bacterium]|nr:sugar phosphate isomerase/epimerase [Oscillospiraceae bacterium]